MLNNLPSRFEGIFYGRKFETVEDTTSYTFLPHIVLPSAVCQLNYFILKKDSQDVGVTWGRGRSVCRGAEGHIISNLLIRNSAP